MDPFHRGLTQSNIDGGRIPHYTKTRAPAISSQTKARNGHLSVSVAPMWTEPTAHPARKMGVASLLFHRTLSPKDTLYVHSYTLEKQQQPHTQLQVHSYAREHQPRHLQHKTPHTQGQSSSQELSCERNKPQSEYETVLTKVTQNESEAENPLVQDEEDNTKLSTPNEEQAEVEQPEIEPTKSVPLLMEQQPQDLGKDDMETPKHHKRKVSISVF